MELQWNLLTAQWFTTVIFPVLFLGLAIPLVVRILRGVIESDPAEGPLDDVYREKDPKTFWRYNAWLIGGMIVLLALLILIWCASPGEGGGA